MCYFKDTLQVGPPDSYQAKLEAKFPTVDVTVSKKADSLYPVVSAASICAKVTRDKCVKGWEFAEGNIVVPETGYGSGYPGDPATKDFLEKCVDPIFGYPNLVRFSWQTVANVLDRKAVRVKVG